MKSKSAKLLSNLRSITLVITSFGLTVLIVGSTYLVQHPKNILPGRAASIPGDINGDGVVDIIDFQLLSNSYGLQLGQSGYDSRCDFNGDNTVDILDFQILSNNFGNSGTVTNTPIPRSTSTPTPRITQGLTTTPHPTAVVTGKSYYVSKGGNNSTGTSWNNAWNNLNQINWSVVQPGDIIYIDGGVNGQTYTASLNVGKSGTSSKSITITGSTSSGHNGQVVIDGQNTRSTGISVSSKNYVVVSNIKITNHTGHDVDIDRSSNLSLQQLQVYVTGRALFIQNSNNVTVTGCDITTPTNLAKQTDGIYSQRNTNNIYENNHIVIYNQDTGGHDDAIQLYEDDSAIVRNNYLAQVNNKVSNAQGLYATTMYGTSIFYNNVVNLGNAQSNALSFRKLTGTGTVEIINNTVYGQRPYHGIWVTETDSPTVKNNISYLLSGDALTLSGSSTNVSNNLTTDPKFVSISGENFHVQSSSPAINAGTSLGSPYNTDKDGVSRPQGSAWDIGAYEYH